MNHFTYGIDERNLRAQLQKIAVPLKDENWARFETYIDSMAPVEMPRSAFRNLHITVNRNVVLPVVFGTVIIMFSFLLFNFISIKNPEKAQATSTPVIRLPEVRPTLPGVPAKQLAVTNVNAESVKTPATEIKQEIASASSTDKVSIEPTEVASAKPAVTSRKHKTTEETLISDIRPNLISEDTDPEIRPN